MRNITNKRIFYNMYCLEYEGKRACMRPISPGIFNLRIRMHMNENFGLQ